MKVLNRRCAGLDVHKAEVVACARVFAGRKVVQEVRRFGTTTRELMALGDWLESLRVTHVAMEATGVYWKPVWHVLDERFALILANAQQTFRSQERRERCDLDCRSAGTRAIASWCRRGRSELRDLTRTRRQAVGRSFATSTGSTRSAGRQHQASWCCPIRWG